MQLRERGEGAARFLWAAPSVLERYRGGQGRGRPCVNAPTGFLERVRLLKTGTALTSA